MSNFSNNIKEEVLEMKEEVNRVSFAYELLKEQRKQNKRLFIALIVVLVMWFCTATYLAYILNDIEVVETSETSENIYDMSTDDGSNNYIGGDNNGEINNN